MTAVQIIMDSVRLHQQNSRSRTITKDRPLTQLLTDTDHRIVYYLPFLLFCTAVSITNGQTGLKIRQIIPDLKVPRVNISWDGMAGSQTYRLVVTKLNGILPDGKNTSTLNETDKDYMIFDLGKFQSCRDTTSKRRCMDAETT